jgi:hypothetical protein
MHLPPWRLHHLTSLPPGVLPPLRAPSAEPPAEDKDEATPGGAPPALPPPPAAAAASEAGSGAANDKELGTQGLDLVLADAARQAAKALSAAKPAELSRLLGARPPLRLAAGYAG